MGGPHFLDRVDMQQADPPSVRNEEAFKFLEQLCPAPRYGVAPMVDASELPFRMLCRRYGATMTWTPMFHSRLFVEQAKYRDKIFTTCPEDRPLIVQFCANDPQTLLEAARYVEDRCDAVEINLGCPQGIAKRGNYGAFLSTQWELVQSLVEILAQNLRVPVFCKIRVLDTLESTLEYARMIEAAGCSLLTVHGRTLHQKGHNMGIANFEYIKAIKETLRIPVFSNGNVRTLEEAQISLQATGADGMMSACGLLANPALFSGLIIAPEQLAAEYLDMCRQYPVDVHIIRGHLFKLLLHVLHVHTDLRDQLNDVASLDACDAIVQELTNRLKDDTTVQIMNAELAAKKKARVLRAQQYSESVDTEVETNINDLFS